jgi:hypothetical protein
MSTGGVLLVGGGAPSVPAWFERELRQYDAALLIAWNPALKKFVVEKCVEHHASGRFEDGKPEHTHVCRRLYILAIQGDEGEMCSPSGRHIEKLKSMDSWGKFGSPEEGGVERALAFADSLDEQRAKREQEQLRDVAQHNQRFNRIQLEKVRTLIQRHNMQPNK